MKTDIAGCLELTRRQRKILEGIAGARKTEHGLAYRAQIVLSWADGLDIRTTARLLGVARDTVRFWRRQWMGGTNDWGQEQKEWMHSILRDKIRELLSDAPRSGSPVKFQAEEVCQIIALACKNPSDVGFPVSHWSARDLREAVLEQKIVSIISIRTVGRFLKKATSSRIRCATT